MNNTGQIIKSKTTERFTVVINDVAKSKDLSLIEKGMMLFLLSLPSDWVIYKKNLYEQFNDSKGTIDRAFKGLQEKGFIISVRIINEKNQFCGWNHAVYDIPNSPILEFPEVGESESRETLKSEIPNIGKTPPILKTNLNKELNNTKKPKNIFVPPFLDEVKKYFLENGYKSEAGEKAFNYYSVADWKDSKGNSVLNWKQKMQSVWFKEENKTSTKTRKEEADNLFKHGI